MQMKTNNPLFDSNKIVCSYEFKKMHLKEYVNLLVKAPVKDVPAYASLGFKKLAGDLRLSLSWVRESDDGVDPGPSIRRASFDISFTSAEIPEIFKAVSSYVSNNRESFKKNLPQKYAEVFDEKKVAKWESYYRVLFNMKVTLKNPVNNSEFIVLANFQKFGDFRVKDTKVFAFPAY